MRVGRIAQLGWRQLVLNRLRWAMLTAITVTSLLVFLVMHALSDASAGELDAAVEATLGYEGTYTIGVPNDLARPLLDTADTLGSVVGRLHPTATVTFLEPVVTLERCPGAFAADADPVADSGSEPATGVVDEAPRLLVVLEARGTATLDGGKRVRQAAGTWCLGGRRLEPLHDDRLGRFIGGALGDRTAPLLVGREQIGLLTVGSPPVRSVANLSVFPVETQPVDALRSALGIAFGPAAVRAGQPPGWSDTIEVRRADSGSDLRQAGQGVQLVYGLIGAAVLGIGAAALVVAQLMTSQARSWFYALTVAWGARRRDIVLLAASEVFAIVVVAMLATVGLAVAFDGPIGRWTEERFGQSMHIVRPSLLVWLLLAAGVVILAASIPAAVAVSRADPLDVLE